MIITNYNYNESEVTAISIVGEYLWIAFSGSGGNCILKKVSVYNCYQEFFEITVPVDEITRIQHNDGYIYLAVDDASYIGVRYKSSNPLTDYDYISKPATISEKSVDLTFDDTYVYWLSPGEITGENAKITKVNISTLNLDEVIDVMNSANLITYARTLTADSNDNLWLATYTNPGTLVKVYLDNGSYTFQEWIIWDTLS